eukprot:632169-Rhodomonas_salina.1
MRRTRTGSAPSSSALSASASSTTRSVRAADAMRRMLAWCMLYTMQHPPANIHRPCNIQQPALSCEGDAAFREQCSASARARVGRVRG